jgi:hypothetical protein
VISPAGRFELVGSDLFESRPPEYITLVDSALRHIGTNRQPALDGGPLSDLALHAWGRPSAGLRRLTHTVCVLVDRQLRCRIAQMSRDAEQYLYVRSARVLNNAKLTVEPLSPRIKPRARIADVQDSRSENQDVRLTDSLESATTSLPRGVEFLRLPSAVSKKSKT